MGQCNFLFDFQIRPPRSAHEQVLCIWYTWSGNTLARGCEKISPEKKYELEHSPWTGQPFPDATKGPDGKNDPLTLRNIIMSFAAFGLPLHKHQLGFLAMHPEHAQWIREQMLLRKQAQDGQPSHDAPKGPDGKNDPLTRRGIIMSYRGFGLPLSKEDLEFLAEYPEHAQ